ATGEEAEEPFGIFTAVAVKAVGAAAIFERRRFRADRNWMVWIGTSQLPVKGWQHLVERAATAVLGRERSSGAHPVRQVLQARHQFRRREDVLEAVVVAMQVEYDIGGNGGFQN